MSADNGIYILKTKDHQYRVAHLQCFDYIYDSVITGYLDGKVHKYIPTRVVEMWGDCKYTYNELTAFQIACRLASRLPVCEYGINVITYNKTWKHILEDAQEFAKNEIQIIKKHGKEDWYYMDKLQKVADGVYLNECTYRKQNKNN